MSDPRNVRSALDFCQVKPSSSFHEKVAAHRELFDHAVHFHAHDCRRLHGDDTIAGCVEQSFGALLSPRAKSA